MQESPTEDRSKFCNFFQPSKTCSPIFFDWKKKKKVNKTLLELNLGNWESFILLEAQVLALCYLKVWSACP